MKINRRKLLSLLGASPASPQCGFASSTEGNRLSEEEQFAKLRLVVEVANEVCGDKSGSSVGRSENLGNRRASSPR
jgi:hypothetical protein